MADVNMNVMIDEKTKDRVEKIAEKKQRTLSGQVRFIIEKWLNEEKE